MGVFDLLYANLPVWAQHVAVSSYGLMWRKRRFGGGFSEELIRFKDRESFSPEQWNHYQVVELRKILVFAFENNPYYREKFSHHGFTLENFRKFELEDLGSLPLLGKNELRKYGTNTLISAKREVDGKFFGSSGSTGTPTQILISVRMHQHWSAGIEARVRHWAGVDRFHPRAMIGGRRVLPESKTNPPFYRYNIFEKQVYMSAYHISEKTANNYLEGIRRHNVQYMTGYAMSNFFLANFFDELALEAPMQKAVITSSEKLTDGMRSTFKKVYNSKTYDSYSGVEACGLISECEYGSLHISPDMGIIELLDDNNIPVSPGEIGEMVCTGILNFDQPLIRYRIGDLAKLAVDQTCPCGRCMPIVDEIIGRVEDTVIGPDGRMIVRFHGVFIGLPNIVKGQVVQNDYDQFVLKVVTCNNLTLKEKETLQERMESQLGPITLKIEELDEIPLNTNGKFRAVISNVKKQIH